MEKYLVKLGRILVEMKILSLPYKAHVSICKSPHYRMSEEKRRTSCLTLNWEIPQINTFSLVCAMCFRDPKLPLN